SPAMLDELMTAGEVLWQGHGPLPGDDGWISLHLADTAPLTLAPPEPSDLIGVSGGTARDGVDGDDDHGSTEHASDAHEVLELMAGGGAYFFRALADALG